MDSNNDELVMGLWHSEVEKDQWSSSFIVWNTTSQLNKVINYKKKIRSCIQIDKIRVTILKVGTNISWTKSVKQASCTNLIPFLNFPA